MLFQKIIFRLKQEISAIIKIVKVFILNAQGAQIAYDVHLKNILVTWPHQVKIMNNTIVEPRVSFKFDGIWSKGPSIIIGKDCFIGTQVEFNITEYIHVADNVLIGSGSRFIDHNHGIALSSLIKTQPCPSSPIHVGEDVWIGANVVVLKGVTIGTGAVVAAGAIVNKSIPAFEIWGGVPAKKIGDRRKIND